MLRGCLLSIALATAALTLPGAAAAAPLLVQDERGDTSLLVSVLQQTHRPLLATSAAPNGVFGPMIELGTPGNTYGAGAPLVAADERGGAVAAWAASVHAATYDYPAVFVSIKPPGGSFGEPEQISPAGEHTGELALDVNARGDAVATWVGYASGGVVYSLRAADGSFGEPQRLPGPITHDLHVVLEADGGALFLGSGTPPDPYATYRRPDGTFADAALLEDVSLLSAAVIASKRGDVLLAWAEDGDVKVRERPAGGDFGATRTVGQVDGASGYYAQVDGVMNDSGDAVLTASNGPVVTALTRDGRDGTFGSQVISTKTYRTTLAINDRGDAVIAFTQDSRWLAGAYRSEGGKFGPARLLAPVPAWLTVGIDGAGVATVVWEDSDGEQVALRVRRFSEDGAEAVRTIATVPTFVQEQPPEACVPNGATVLKRGSRAVITSARYPAYTACLLGRGQPVDLGRIQPYGPGDFTEVQAPPRFALRGPFAAAVVSAYNHDMTTSSYVSVVDLRDDLGGFSTAAPALPSSAPAAVPALKLAPGGAPAWIACSSVRHKDGRPPGRCTRTGRAEKQVFVLPPHTPVAFPGRRVAKGRHIDPASLTISGGRVLWRDGKRRYSAPLD